MRTQIFAAIFLLLFAIPAHAMEQRTEAKQAIIVDFETGQVLLDKKSDGRMPTSSMSKVMTTYMVFDALKNGTIEMDSKLPVSEKAWRKGGSKMFVEVGKKIKVSDLLRGVIVQSGNDATIVFAEGLAGSEKAFAKKMTEKAHEIGMKNSNFVNASGWPDINHYSTAEDLALMAKRMISDFPEYYKIFSEKEFTYNKIKQPNRNPLLYRDIGADGMKTGHTDAGGYGLIGTAVKDERRVIMVLNGMESEKERAEESSRLISWALNSFENKTIVKANQKISQAPVAMGTAETVDLLVKEELRLTLPKSAKDNFTVDIKYKSPLVAPLKEEQQVGTLTLNVPGMDPMIRPLITAQPIEKPGFFKHLIMKIKYKMLGQV